MIVIKIGGGEGNLIESLCRDIAELVHQGGRLILVHGGSHLTNELSTKLEHPPRFITSPSGFTSRYTDRRTMEIFQMAYCGQANKAIVECLQKQGINAIGLSGMDGRLWEGSRKKSIRAVENGKTVVIRDNLTGIVERVNQGLLAGLIDQGYLPVITPPAISFEREPINVDGDRAAAASAVAMQAKQLIILSNISGLLRNVEDPDSLIPNLRRDELDQAITDFAEGRMRIKLLAAGEAIDGGVSQVIIGDSRPEHCLKLAIEGIGTVIRPSQATSTSRAQANNPA